MNLVFRLLGVVFQALCSSHRLSVFSTSRVSMHVWPNDLDLNLHVNNSRYLSYCDLGKVDLMLRAGVGRLAIARKWQPIVGGCLIRFRFSLKAFQRITVVTRVLCWDEKWFYALHLIESRRGVAAVALAKTSVRDRDGVVSPGAVLKDLDFTEPSPPPPEPVLQWIATEESLHVEERC